MNETPTALWRHTETVYNAMAKEATIMKVGDASANVYEGFITKLFAENDVPMPYYRRVLTSLEKLGCALQVRRGGRTTMSRWVILKAPVLEEFQALDQDDKPPQGPDPMEQRVTALEKLVGGTDIPKALFDLQEQINELRR